MLSILKGVFSWELFGKCLKITKLITDLPVRYAVSKQKEILGEQSIAFSKQTVKCMMGIEGAVK